MKYYLNAFPKSGLHLLDALCKPLTLNDTELWAGTYTDNAWTLNREAPERVTAAICYTPDNWRLIGHCCYDDELEWYMELSSIAHIFVYRDLRDVAVSQAHHILSDNADLHHPGRELYRALGGFDDVLRAVWYGLDRFPGVPERWQPYAPWLTRPGVLVLCFEDVIADLEAAAGAILGYAARFTHIFDGGGMVETSPAAMAASARDTTSITTFRKGIAGEWKQYQDVIPEWVDWDLQSTSYQYAPLAATI